MLEVLVTPQGHHISVMDNLVPLPLNVILDNATITSVAAQAELISAME